MCRTRGWEAIPTETVPGPMRTIGGRQTLWFLRTIRFMALARLGRWMVAPALDGYSDTITLTTIFWLRTAQIVRGDPAEPEPWKFTTIHLSAPVDLRKHSN